MIHTFKYLSRNNHSFQFLTDTTSRSRIGFFSELHLNIEYEKLQVVTETFTHRRHHFISTENILVLPPNKV